MKLKLLSILFLIAPLCTYAQWKSFSSDINSEIRDVSYVSATKVFFISNNLPKNTSSLNISNDGGITPTTVSNGNAGIHYGCLHFFDASKGLICGYSETDNTNYVWKTLDGGLTFKSIVLDSKTSQDLPRPVKIIFTTDKIGYIVTTSTSGSSFHKTLDGGDTWNPIILNEYVYNKLTAITSTKAAYRFILRNSILLFEKSVDDLKTWQSLSIPNSASTFNFQNDTLGFMGTTVGEIFKTTDGGKNWVINARIPNGSINNICFITSTFAYISVKSTSSNDYILRTTNGGNSWQTVYILNNRSNSINNLYFFNENIGLSTGSSNISTVANASNAPTSKRPTFMLSGADATCKNNFNMLFRLTGTSPWKIIVQENNAINKSVYSITTPTFEFNYTPIDSNSTAITPFSVEDAEGLSTEVGGASTKIPTIPAATILKDSQRLFALGSAINVKLKLTGCSPWSLKFKENLLDTVVTKIFDANYIYKTKLNSSYLDFRLVAVKSLNGDWFEYNGNLSDSILNYVRYSTNTTAVTDFNSNFILEANPNPFDNKLSLKVSSKNTINAQIELFDIRGAQLLNLNSKLNEGMNSFNFDTPFNAGIYFLRIRTEKEVSKVVKLIKM